MLSPNQNIRLLRVAATLTAAALLLPGCITQEIDDGGDREGSAAMAGMPEVFRSVRPADLPPDETYLPFTNRASRSYNPAAHPLPAPAPAPAVRAPATVPAGPVAKDWQVLLTIGQRKASVNGVELWLCEPAVIDQGSKPKKGGKLKVAPTDTDRRLTLGPLLNAPATPLVGPSRRPRIFIDPGHGGKDPGTTSGSARESAIALDVARRLANYLAQSGYDVRLSRADDKTFLELEERNRLASAWAADVFVSIHLNSGPTAANGIETYALPPVGQLSTEAATKAKVSMAAKLASKVTETGNRNDLGNIRLAWCIHRRLTAATERRDRGIRRARYTVLRESKMPAVLVELGFLSNSSDAAFYSTAEGRDRAAVGICRGIMDFCAGRISPKYPALPIGRPAKPAAPAPVGGAAP